MKKTISVLMAILMVAAIAVGFTGCGAEDTSAEGGDDTAAASEELTLESKTIYGLTFDVPSDFVEFSEEATGQIANNGIGTATIAVTAPKDIQGVKPADITEDVYIQTQMSAYTDVTVNEFDTEASIDGVPALFVSATGTTSQGMKVNIYNYMIFHEDGTMQGIVFGTDVSNETSVSANIDALLQSVTIAE